MITRGRAIVGLRRSQSSSSSSSISIDSSSRRRNQKPLVVLAGWLGCQPKSLRRYEALYRDLGYAIVVSKIATPAMVGNFIFRKHDETDGKKPPVGWPQKNEHAIIIDGSMRSLAWDVLREIHQANCSMFLFHAFSNGGFFLWENVRQILEQYDDPLLKNINGSPSHEIQPTGTDSIDQELIASLHSKLGGVVMDSCPAFDFTRFSEAMQYVPFLEKVNVLRHTGMDYFLTLGRNPRILKQLDDYSDKIFAKLRDSSSSTPQLYLYSQDDPLTSFAPLDEIVEHRQKQLGSEIIWSRRWEKSAHCAHYRYHPEEYRKILSDFSEMCIQQQQQNTSQVQPKSKL